MKTLNELLSIMNATGEYIIDEQDSSFDEAINEGIDLGVIAWSDEFDDMVVKA